MMKESVLDISELGLIQLFLLRFLMLTNFGGLNERRELGNEALKPLNDFKMV